MAEKLTYEKVLKMFAETDRQLKAKFAETDRQLKAQMAETDRFLKEKFAETEALIRANAKEIYSVGLSNGDFAGEILDPEEIFYNSLEERPQLGAERFICSEKDVKILHGNPLRTLDEYDIQLSAKGKIAIIEVKYKVEPVHLKKLLLKVRNFFTAFPDKKNIKIFLGIGGLSFSKNAEEMARDRGIAVLKLKGKALEDNNLDIFPLTPKNLSADWENWAQIVAKERGVKEKRKPGTKQAAKKK